MTRKRIAHLADLHLDANPDVSIPCLEFALASAAAADVDAIVVAGDIWHRGIFADDRSPLVRTLRAFRDASAERPIVMIKGNSHDMPGSLDVFREIADDRHDIHVFTTPGMVHAGGVAFACLPYPDKAHLMRWATSSDQDETDRTAEQAIREICGGFAAQFAVAYQGAPFANTPFVLVFHGNVLSCFVESGQMMLGGDVLVPVDALELSTADYIAGGHIHRRQKIGSRFHFSGSLHHVSHGETGPRVMLITDVWRGGYEIVDEVVLPSRAKITVDATSLNGGGIQIPAEIDVRGAEVKLRVRMTPEQASTINTDAMAQWIHSELGAYCVFVERVLDRGERIARVEGIASRQMLRDKIAAWGVATGTEIPAGALAKADVVESFIATQGGAA